MSTPRSWFKFTNKAESDTAELSIYDEIGGWGVRVSDVIRELKSVSGKALTVRIHSPGGSVLDGHAIYNALRRHKGGVTTEIDGIAASMASVIALAGDRVKMAANAFFMIHNPSGGVWGEADEMRQTADVLDKMRDGLVNIYASKSGKDAAEIEAMMNAETWLNAADALAMGFIDEISGEVNATNKLDVSQFKNLPAALVDTGAEVMSPTEIAEFKATLSAAQDQAKSNFEALKEVRAELDKERLAARAALEDAAKASAKAIEELTAKIQTPEQINAEIARVIAANGHKPVGDDAVTDPVNPNNKPNPELTGLARAMADQAAKKKLSK